MKLFIITILSVFSLSTFANNNIENTNQNNSQTISSNYSGIWQDDQNQLYSIYQGGDDSLVFIELKSNQVQHLAVQQGLLRTTELATDLALSGPGYFVLEMPNGEHIYTRNGHFSRDSSGNLTNDLGYLLVTKDNKPLSFLSDSNAQSYFPLPDCPETTLIGPICSGIPLSISTPITDQIIVADIYPSDIRYQSDYYTVVYNSPVRYSVSDNGTGTQVYSHSLEDLSSTEQSWKAATGLLINQRVSLKEMVNDRNTNYSGRHIQFTDEITASLTYQCPESDVYNLCSANLENMTRNLSKIY